MTGLRTKIHGAKVSADSLFGKIACSNLIAEVKALTGIEGIAEHVFHDVRKWRLDCAWPSHMLALELNGWTSHHRRKRIREDNVKIAAAVRLGWRVMFADVDQMRRHAALWVADVLNPQQGDEKQ